MVTNGSALAYVSFCVIAELGTVLLSVYATDLCEIHVAMIAVATWLFLSFIGAPIFAMVHERCTLTSVLSDAAPPQSTHSNDTDDDCSTSSSSV